MQNLCHEAQRAGQARFDSLNGGNDFGGAAIYVDAGDFAGVIRAAADLQADIARVTGCTPVVTHDSAGIGTYAIVVGSLERSSLVKRLTATAAIAGKWESFLTQAVPKPLPGVASAPCTGAGSGLVRWSSGRWMSWVASCPPTAAAPKR